MLTRKGPFSKSVSHALTKLSSLFLSPRTSDYSFQFFIHLSSTNYYLLYVNNKVNLSIRFFFYKKKINFCISYKGILLSIRKKNQAFIMKESWYWIQVGRFMYSCRIMFFLLINKIVFAIFFPMCLCYLMSGQIQVKLFSEDLLRTERFSKNNRNFHFIQRA